MDHKQIAIAFINLGLTGKFSDGLKYFLPSCKTHNPYISRNIETLIQAMDGTNKEGKGQYPNAEFTIKQAIEEKDLVALHTELFNDKTKPDQGSLRQMQLFSFERDKLVEYWDITQQVTPNMPNAVGAF